MKKVLLLSLFLIFLVQIKSQNTEIEIYRVQSNTLVKGTLEDSSGDSLRIRVDSLHTLVFAKAELEGRELPVSKEVKNLRRKLVFEEARKEHESIPGMFQFRNGEKSKGRIIFVLTGISCIGLAATLGVLVVDIFSINGLLAIITNTGAVLTPSLILYSIASIWSRQDHWHTIQKMVNNRYYYRGDIIPKMTINN